MVTGHEVKMYQDINTIARSLQQIAMELKALVALLEEELEDKPAPEPGSLPNLPQSAFNLESDDD